MYNLNHRIDALSSTSIVQNWEPSSKMTGSWHGHDVEVISSDISYGCKCTIIPPHLQRKVEDLRLHDENEEVRILAHSHLEIDETLREQRHAVCRGQLPLLHLPHPFDEDEDDEAVVKKFDPKSITRQLVRNVYDGKHRERLPGTWVVSAQGDPMDPTTYKQKGRITDSFVSKALQNALNVFLFYLKNYRYNSIDGKGMPITSTVHFGRNYENAFWNGRQMVYGDGSDLFKAFVYFLDVVGHEMTHGVTGSRLEYEGEAGALNEHFSDVMGYLVYMYVNGLSAEDADWLLADGIIEYDGKSYALRSFKAPGTAYDIPDLGKDPQPSKYGDLYTGEEDNGGVHINSGIPNHAFYLFAMALGGKPWEKAGLIWFTTMMTPRAFTPDASMKEFAEATIKTAKSLFKEDPKIAEALLTAWRKVEVLK